MLKKTVRDEYGQPIGVVVAIKLDDNFYGIGWAACNRNLDRYDKKLGEKIACGRAGMTRTLHREILRLNKNNLNYVMPRYMVDELLLMADRARRYYKGMDCLQDKLEYYSGKFLPGVH